jgi:hypothetical protein
MKRLLLIAFLILVVLVGYITIWSSREDPTDGTTFYYYPRANIYYDLDRERYIYPDTVKGGWQKSKKLPGDGKDKLGQYVILNNPTPPVWAHNSQHRLVYGATLYARKEDVRRKFIEDSLRSVVVRKPAPPKKKGTLGKDTTDERNAIERFFDRLFGNEDDGGN